MNTHETYLLSTENLAIGFGQHQLFQNLNLQLRPGELLCFMGSNGIGKTTLLKTLAGLHRPLAGKVIQHGSRAAVVLTDRIHAYNMTVRDLVTYGRYPYLSWNLKLTSEDLQIIEQSIVKVRLQALAEKNINEISDGQLQMALIGRALAQTTPLLLLDEPTAHLDLNNRLEIMTLLKRLARETKKAILVATHELDLALQTADQIWLATSEKNILMGTPEDLVLDGSFDKVFQFKGFDLKTGKVQHPPHRGVALQIIGEGHSYLWTKNALERSGYEVNDASEHKIIIAPGPPLMWEFQNQKFETLGALLKGLAGALNART